MSKTVKDSLNESAVPTSTLSLMKNVNHINNLWSIMNNTTSSTGDGVEAGRSVILVALDIISDFSKNTKLEAVADVSQALIIGHRLVKNLDIYWDYRDFNEVVDTNGNKAFYNKGLIPKNVIADVMADVVTLSKTIGEVVADIRKIAGKLVTPASLAMDVVSTLFTVISNTIASTITAHEKLGLNAEVYLNLTKEQKEALQQQWADDERFSIHKDEFSFGEVFGEAFLTTLTSWGTLTAVFEQVLGNIVPDGLNPFETPNDIDLLGSADNDVIDADSWFDDAYRIYGNAGNDTLIGGDHNDKILGGTGNDIINGKEGDDKLDGAEGYDTYHIKDRDTIYDKDGKGKILFDGKQLPKDFILKDGTSGIWEAKDNQGNVLYTAIKGANDLLITSTNSPADSVTIKDFFNIAIANGTTYTALSINLGHSQEDIDKNRTYTIKAIDGFLSHIGTGAFPAQYLDIYGSNKTDTIFGTGRKYLNIDAGDGHDLIFGGDMADVIRGGADNDVISGRPSIMN